MNWSRRFQFGIQSQTSVPKNRISQLTGLKQPSLALLLVVISGVLCHQVPAKADDSILVRVQAKNGGPYVGELISDGADSIEVFDLVLNKSVTIPKTSVIRTENPIDLDAAVRYAGYAAVMSRKISVLASKPTPKGKIARVSPQVVYLTLGAPTGIRVGQKVSVFRGEGDIVDPDTGKVLASERPKIAELEVTEVNESVSKAKLIGDLEVKLEIGDEVELTADRLVVAVCPLSNDDGSSNPAGASMAEELTTALVQRKVSVVERSALDMVLTELIAQNTVLFDEASAQKIGKLTGARMVLTGKIVRERSTSRAHMRLIDVETGEILLAISAPVKTSSRTSSGSSRSSAENSSGSSRGSSSKYQLPEGFDSLGKSRSLPRYLATNAPLARVENGAVRFQGTERRDEYADILIVTKDRDLIQHDFSFEALITFGPDDGIVQIGFGSGQREGSANRRENSVMVRFHPPHFGNGEVQVEASKKPNVLLGKVTQPGVHRVQFLKEGDSLSIIIDPENDGPSDDDMETVIPDIKEYLPGINSKNSLIFIGGSGTYVGTRFDVKD